MSPLHYILHAGRSTLCASSRCGLQPTGSFSFLILLGCLALLSTLAKADLLEVTGGSGNLTGSISSYVYYSGYPPQTSSDSFNVSFNIPAVTTASRTISGFNSTVGNTSARANFNLLSTGVSFATNIGAGYSGNTTVNNGTSSASALALATIDFTLSDDALLKLELPQTSGLYITWFYGEYLSISLSKLDDNGVWQKIYQAPSTYAGMDQYHNPQDWDQYVGTLFEGYASAGQYRLTEGITQGSMGLLLGATSVSPSAVPEPGSLLLVGIAAASTFRRRASSARRS